MEKMRMWLLGLRIEWHWFFILRYRKNGNRLIEQGVPLASAKLLQISRIITRHGVHAMKYKKQYEDICGLTDYLQSARAQNHNLSKMNT
ncbi:MAG: hypothetical protein PHY23_05360 [Oscillospiraceae bacterium]|nr:hypothetical protein [Oscillospiraceae bacterium]